MPKPKRARPKCIYQVITTEFWRNSYRIEAENHGAALVAFESLKQTKALPEPERSLLGYIDPPEQVLDPEGKLVYNNYPTGEDHERMLFLELWRRMIEYQLTAEPVIRKGIEFICRIKRWDPEIMIEQVRRMR